jgi:serine/threonine-protein kinase
MGEVYRASDTKLNRDVALKILPDAVAQDPERLARFKREAQVLAALSHPSVGAIYGLDEADGRPFLVLELIDGETLAERIASGALPIPDALTIAIQIAEALEAAHEKGIVHRDLKPANVKITREGKVKVLDFGLAKALDQPGAAERGHLSHSPTLSLMATEAGMILGTAAYMSPEQAKGFPTDQRTDVFSFGCVLYEMLTGLKVFNADTATETLAAVLMRDPDLNALPPALHPGLRRLVARCLEKNPKRRWHAIGDVRYEIESIVANPQTTSSAPAAASTAPAAVPRPLWARALPLLITAVVVAAGAIALEQLRSVPVAPLVRFPFVLPDDQAFTTINSGSIAVSPDGTRVVYVANRQLYIRAIGDMEAKPIPGTQLNVSYPFFSPEGQWIGFWSGQDGAIKKVAITGGAPITLSRLDARGTAGIQGASWEGDTIVFAVNGSGIFRVPANGGEPGLIARASEAEVLYGPQLLEGGKAVLYTVTAESGADRWEKAQIVVQSIGANDRKVVVRGGSAAQYIAATGHLLFALGGTLLAQPFDVRRMEVRGGPIPLVEQVARARNAALQSGVAHFAVSPSGTLASITGATSAANAPVALALVERSGASHLLEVPPQPYLYPRISPDGRQLAVATDDGREANIWVGDVKASGSLRRLTFGGRNLFPTWSPDGRFLAFQSDREGDAGIFRQPADGSGAADRVTHADSGVRHEPESWSPDGTISFNLITLGSNQGVWTVALAGDRKPTVFVDTPDVEKHSAFSPNGRWLAYMVAPSNARNQVYLQPFPATGAKYLVPSEDAARAPVWSHDGRQLFYHDSTSNKFYEVDVHTDSGVSFGRPTVLPIEGTIHPITQRNYDVTPDGKQLIVVLPAAAPGKPAQRPTQQINIVLNWFQELNARVPTK